MAFAVSEMRTDACSDAEAPGILTIILGRNELVVKMPLAGKHAAD